MREFYLKNKPLIILWLFSIIALIIFSGHYSNILFDVGREVYYPERILEGKVLYKDLFNIYGPFSYLWNAFLYKIFGINLSALYMSGAVCSIGIVSGIYLIAKKFLNTPLSFTIAIFTIVTGICANHLFNFTFPYSWAMLYGTVGFLYSLYFFIKYRETELSKYFYLSGLLAGFAAANKYEFIPFAGFLFILALLTKNRVYVLNFIVSILVFPVLSFGILFLQGLRIENLITVVNEIAKMSASQTLKYFYTISGVFFTPKMLPIWLINILMSGISFELILLGYKYYDKNKFLSITLMTIFSIIMFIITSPTVFVFLIPLLVILAIAGIKKIKSNETLLILIFSAILVSIKSFWGLVPLNYGNFYLSIVLTAFFALLFCLINKKYQVPAAVFLVAVSFHFLFTNLYQRTYLTGKISSPYGVIYTHKHLADASNEVLSFLNNDDYKGMKALIYPEGLLINFLSKNKIKSDDYYNSFIPLYYESMGEDKFINFLKETKPEFVIFNNQSTADYYFKNICTDYAYIFCGIVKKDYVPVKQIDNKIKYEIFRLKH